MFLKVSQKRVYWGHDELWFTSMDLKPHEVTIDDLTVETRDAILDALQLGDLIETDENGKRVEDVTDAVGEIKKSKPVSLNISPMIEGKAKELLKGGITSIKREVAYARHPLFLSAALNFEKGKKKPRKTVVSLLEKRLLALAGGAERVDYMPDLEIEKGEEIVLKRSDMVLFDEPVEEE